ncbi:RNA polymerase sigma factor [Echinicola shivajiensis]|uniref:RNA polymerase sigma factor n=1 Tax=Echinicola shivajiensis TaxID=1035916 RepID=UPI001BFCCD4F|nr:sigma-70 family RNA polymerase sigma factor [Echinicola shivajiensis]
MNEKLNVVEEKGVTTVHLLNKDYQQMDDSAIWAAFKSGNESAFIFIYERFFDSLFEFGSLFCRNENMVKDAVQDLFIEIRKSRSKLGDTNNIKFYLFKSLKRRVLKEQKTGFYKLLDLKNDYSFSVEFSPEQLIIDKQISQEMVEKLNLSIQRLSPRKREIIYYFYYEGLSYQEIKEIMGFTNIKSARNLLYNALEFLKGSLG